jgi:hypothetical protein
MSAVLTLLVLMTVAHPPLAASMPSGLPAPMEATELDQRRGPAPIVVPARLATALAPMLDGLNATVAARDFRTLEQFVTVLVISRNLEIPFVTLKKRVVSERQAVEAAVKRMRPLANAAQEVARADKEARALIAANR